MRGAAARAAAMAVLVLAGACGAPVPSKSPSTERVALRAEDHGFVVTAQLPSSTFDGASAIPLETTLTYVGPAAKATIWGSGGGPVSMTYTELTGARRSMGGIMTADCAPHEFTRGVPSSVRPFKSWAASRDDPNYDFYLAWGNDPDLHLPTGRWRIDILVSGYLAPCEMNAPGVSLTIPIELTIR